ncbi:hypothetical protein GCK72_000106 [Caenorhabditis remanei]|uniref:Major sperm protein n=1 Tax=Caenorhabditis remanei TaxID=31234 RepID=A0A6A5HNY1_CAERE|nr:hypothetical protein GCK72_000106 [Caenorhabditis remanei]KAF1768294.1 hypothetical protein GCK72_000106 [Caenorhabditis remanei]
MQNYCGGEHKSGSGKGFPKTPFEIHQGQVRQEFERLHHDGKSLLTASDLPENKYIVFCGLLELTNRACVHFELRNPTQKTILFNIRTPISHCFFVKPHVGMIEAGGKAKIYCTFKGKCHRVPSDYCMIYSIYHIVIDEKSTALIKEDEFSSSNLRAVWNKKGRGVEIKNILHLSCKFDEKAKPEHTCKHHKIGRIIDLNDHGEVVQAGPLEDSKGEPSNTPPSATAKGRRLQKTPSVISTEEMPKTATSEKTKKK